MNELFMDYRISSLYHVWEEQKMNRQIGAKQPLFNLIQQIIDHLDQAEVFEIVGDHDRAQRERAIAEEYSDMYRYRTQ